MQVHLGPIDVSEMEGWLRFARRVLCDLRTEPGDMDSRFAQSLLTEWCSLIDAWSDAIHDEDEHFLWEEELEPDRAEYLLHSLQKTMRSATVAHYVTPADHAAHGMVTFHIMQRLIDGLESEGTAHVEYVEQMRSEITRFGASLAAN